MTDTLSERLGLEIATALMALSMLDVPVLMAAPVIQKTLTPILRDEIAAVRERTLEEAFKAQCWMCHQNAYIFFDEKTLHFHHKDGSVCGADRIRVTFAALNTPHPEVKS